MGSIAQRISSNSNTEVKKMNSNNTDLQKSQTFKSSFMENYKFQSVADFADQPKVFSQVINWDEVIREKPAILE
jgi:ABC-type Fe3+-citrate transport system substrate-binding protein